MAHPQTPDSKKDGTVIQPRPFRLLQARLYAHLADCVKRDANGHILAERRISIPLGRLLRVPMTGYIAKCAVCGDSRLIVAAWALIDSGKLGYCCAECDAFERACSAVDCQRWP